MASPLAQVEPRLLAPPPPPLAWWLVGCPMAQRRGRTIQLCSWNVRGLGQRTKCVDVNNNLVGRSLDVVCLQETKLQEISTFKASSFLPPGVNEFKFKPSEGASGGILTAWNPRLLRLCDHSVGAFSVSTLFELPTDASRLAVSCVYAPCTDDRRAAFVDEVTSLAARNAGAPLAADRGFQPHPRPRRPQQ